MIIILILSQSLTNYFILPLSSPIVILSLPLMYYPTPPCPLQSSSCRYPFFTATLTPPDFESNPTAKIPSTQLNHLTLTPLLPTQLNPAPTSVKTLWNSVVNEMV